jgi:soluble lytic murein transglycosylase
MPLLRAFLLSAATAAAAVAQTSPAPSGTPLGLGRNGDVVMMQPIPDGSSAAPGGLPGPRPSRIRVLTATDHDLFVRAFDSAGRGDWKTARSLAAQGSNPVARRLLEWRYALDRDSGATFAEIDAAIRNTESNTSAGTWPLRGTLQARAEDKITPDMPASVVVEWFGARTPNSSIGKIRLGEALLTIGETARGAALIRAGWTEGSFDIPIEQAILQRDAASLTPESDRARLDALLWRGEITAAKRQVSRVDAATADIANARIALASIGLPRAEALVNTLKDSSDPNLLFDWSRALRLADRDRDAHVLLLRTPAADLVKNHAARWWAEVNIQARDALAGAEPKLAYDLVQHAGFTGGDQYGEQQFLAGFIALRFLKEPNSALAAFQNLDAAVSRPISKSRAKYWQGRAYEALGDNASARAHYRLAAGYPETFYGQLALARIDPSPTLRLSDTAVEAVNAAELDGDALMSEIKVLAELGQTGTLRQFVERDAAAYPSPRHIKRLMLQLINWGFPEIAVRLAKGLSYDGAYLHTFTHPTIPLPAYPGPGAPPDPALVLGLIRQETEFDAYAVSSAGARGLMQIMLTSAKIAARQAKLPYRPGALLSDSTYNMQLGMTECRGQLDRFDGSWVLAAAAYNAGPTNVRKWLGSNGDPRVTDPIDWIEQIPFGETRNYVQRVLENTEVYRSRLAGKEVALKLLADLYAPNPPPVSVLAGAAAK